MSDPRRIVLAMHAPEVTMELLPRAQARGRLTQRDTASVQYYKLLAVSLLTMARTVEAYQRPAPFAVGT